MRVAIKKTKVYKFKELSKDVKEEIIQKWHDNDEYAFLEGDLYENLKDMDKYFSSTKLQYSLSSCQGDGLSFSGEFNLLKFLNYRTKLKKSVKRAICEIIYKVHSTGNTGHYCYAHTTDIDYDDNYAGDKKVDRLYKLFEEKILPKIQNYYMGICKQLEDLGYKIINYRMDNEDFSEMAESNGYEYTKNGEIY